MATITIDDDVYDRLAGEAERLGVSVGEILAPLVSARYGEAAPRQISDAEWQARSDEWTARALSRRGRYPVGFRLDDSRDAMYDERDESQLGPRS